MNSRRILLLTSVVASQACGQNCPPPEVLLHSWEFYAQAVELACQKYELKGEVVTDNSFGGTQHSSGSWHIWRDRTKYRYEFRTLPTELHIATFDGTIWRGVTVPKSDKDEPRGTILNKPLKVFSEYPEETYRKGLANIYPYTLTQLVAAPWKSIKSNEHTFIRDILAKAAGTSSHLVTAHGQQYYELVIQGSDTEFPERIRFQTIGKFFVPVKFQRVTSGADKSPTTIAIEVDHSTKVDGLLIPSRCELTGWQNDILKYDQVCKFTLLGVISSFPDELYKVTFPESTIAVDQVQRKQYIVAKGRPENRIWVLAGCLLIGPVVYVVRKLASKSQ